METSANLPSKRELLSFQESWLRPAGFAALAGAFLIAASIVYQRAGLDLPDSDSDADQLVFAHAHSGRLVLSSIIQAIGFCLFTPLIYVLFSAAAGRTERVRRALLPLALLGPVAFGVGVAISSAGTSDAADTFVSKEPAVVQQARENSIANEQQQGTASAKGKGAESPTTTSVPSTTTTATTTSTNGTTTTAAAAKTPDEVGDDAREDLADDTNKDTTLLIVGGIISTVGVLGMVFGMIYTSIWSMRTGLLTRFWGALGIAFGLFLVIPIFPPIPGLVLWFAALGLMFIGTWPRPLPPAWEAGEAIPWESARDDMGPPSGGGPPGTVEGSGREVSEAPLPEAGEASEPPEPPYGETQGQRRKKRKRRS